MRPGENQAGLPRSQPVLIVCYDFPDVRSAGVIRTYQLAKQLPALGWQPVILTGQRCPGHREYDVEASDGPLNCPRFTVATSRLLVPFRPDRPEALPAQGDAVPRGDGLPTRVVRFASQLAVPDGKIGWWPAAVRRGRRVGRDFRVRACLSVSPRPTSHFVARRIARSLGIPWVADFALPWSDAHWLSGRPRFIEWLDRKLEGGVVRSADHVIVAYADIARGLCGRHDGRWQQGISVVPTGFADDRFAGESTALRAKFTIAYPGNHFSEADRHGGCFLRALDEWIAGDPGLADQVECVFIGKRDDDLVRQRASMAHPGVVRLQPFVSHRACIQAILASHGCVVNTVGNRIPAKVYECMRAGKPILALAEPGSDLERLMSRYPRGMTVPARDVSAIRDALHRVWQARDATAAQRPEAASPLERYSSEHSAEIVAGILDHLSRARSRSAPLLHPTDPETG